MRCDCVAGVDNETRVAAGRWTLRPCRAPFEHARPRAQSCVSHEPITRAAVRFNPRSTRLVITSIDIRGLGVHG
eukprot:5792191-Prymnesium_polylepis.1